MKALFNKALAGVAVFVSILALIFRAKSKQHKAKAEQQEQRADMSEAVVKQTAKAQRQQIELRKKQEQERDAVQKSLDDGARDHFDKPW